MYAWFGENEFPVLFYKVYFPEMLYLNSLLCKGPFKYDGLGGGYLGVYFAEFSYELGCEKDWEFLLKVFW
jgi:hypothetical protein